MTVPALTVTVEPVNHGDAAVKPVPEPVGVIPYP